VNDPDGRAGRVMPAALRQVATAGSLKRPWPPKPPRSPRASDEAAEDAADGVVDALVVEVVAA